MGQVLCIVITGALLLMSCFEWVKYRRAAGDPEQIPYPRRRLSRRIAVAFLLIACLLLSCFWPDRISVWGRLALGFFLLFGVLISMFLLFRDLRETSISVVQVARELDAHTSQELNALIDEARKRAADSTNPDKPQDDDASPSPSSGSTGS